MVGENKIVNFFEKFIDQDSLFNNKKILQSSYHPDNIIHRDEQIPLH